jgi:hypothetical protein
MLRACQKLHFHGLKSDQRLEGFSGDLPDHHHLAHPASIGDNSATMAPLDEALDFLKSSDSVDYAEAARYFNCDKSALRRRHQGKQRSRQDDSRHKDYFERVNWFANHSFSR